MSLSVYVSVRSPACACIISLSLSCPLPVFFSLIFVDLPLTHVLLCLVIGQYPAWFDSHADSLSASDLARYRAQHVAMGKLLQELDRHGNGQQRLVVLTSHMEEVWHSFCLF